LETGNIRTKNNGGPKQTLVNFEEEGELPSHELEFIDANEQKRESSPKVLSLKQKNAAGLLERNLELASLEKLQDISDFKTLKQSLNKQVQIH
jgi:hypothetical protein